MRNSTLWRLRLGAGIAAFVAGASLVARPAVVLAQPVDDDGGEVPPAVPSPPAAEPVAATPPAVDLEALRGDNERLLEEVELLQEDLEFLQRQVDGLQRVKGRLSGYIDFGGFWVGGDGTGFRTDLGNVQFPEYDEVVPGSWVFMGDPLSTAINSRGEPASTGESRAVTFDPVRNGGAASFILNAINVGLFAGVGETLTVNAMFDIVPRSRDVSNVDGTFLGDFVDAKLAYMEYMVPTDKVLLSIYAGKFDSVLGVEYRSQDSPNRLGVTPSLICRYTCGYPLGLKARAGFIDNTLILNVAVTNGSHFREMFPFFNEVDANDSKTLSGRVSYALPVGAGMEVGASGAVGAQDNQPANDLWQWHYGFDIHWFWNNLHGAAEFVQGKARGDTAAGGPACDLVPCLEYKGAYGQIGYRATNWLIPYARIDWRDALHLNGGSFVYISDEVRFTGGLRLELGTNLIIKSEYVVNRELGRVPQFPNDVFTSSLVMRY